MHSSSRASAEAVSQQLQSIYSCESSAYAKFHQILFKIATTGAMTDRQTDRQACTHTDRRQRCYNLSHGQKELYKVRSSHFISHFIRVSISHFRSFALYKCPGQNPCRQSWQNKCRPDLTSLNPSWLVSTCKYRTYLLCFMFSYRLWSYTLIYATKNTLNLNGKSKHAKVAL